MMDVDFVSYLLGAITVLGAIVFVGLIIIIGFAWEDLKR